MSVEKTFSGGGQMGGMINSFDWSSHPLGKISAWPQSLISAASICINSNFPIAIYWGKELYLIYNDAWSPIPGGKHPWALGKPAIEVWPEIWNDIKPLFDEAINKGIATGSKDALLPMNRHGFVEECYFDFTFTPVYGAGDKVEGIFNAVIETTYRVINERRVSVIKQLTEGMSACASREELNDVLTRVFSESAIDVPFAGVYFSDGKGGVTQEVSVNFSAFNIQDVLNLPEVTKAPHTHHVVSLKQVEHDGIASYWPEPSTEFCYLPLILNGKLTAHIILGISSRIAFNADYLAFFQEILKIYASELRSQETIAFERQRANELEALDKAKTVFFSNISHEFRTPLTLMLGPLEELLNRASYSFPEKEYAKIEIAQRNSLRLLKLVNTLLDFSRIESGRQKAHYVLTDIVSFTRNLAANFQSAVDKTGLQLIIKADHFIQPVYIDKDMWEKIVFNLLSNAFKYTLKGTITLGLHSIDKHAVLTVSDTGIGIPKDELPRLFQRFHRIENNTGRTFEGTGIGLSMIKELVKLLGGEISVASEVGQGSTFTVTIPFGKEHIPKDQIKDADNLSDYLTTSGYVEELNTIIAQPVSTNGEQNNMDLPLLLIVDDNADMREHLKSLLVDSYRVTTAANGMEALHKVKAQTPDLILTDIMMPIMNGTDLLREIKTQAATRNIPVILLTARAGEESRIEGYESGADDYLVKPFSSKELRARIRTQLKVTHAKRNADTHLHSVFSQAPVALVIFKGRNLVCEFVNDLYLEIVKKERENFLGKPLFEALPETKEVLHPIAMKLLDTGEPFPATEFEITLHRNGRDEVCYFNSIWTPLRDENNTISGIICCAHEVTQQVTARKALSQAQ